jgi:large repetitive protein
VHDPISSDHELRNAVSSDTPGSNCPPQSTDPACTSTVLLPGMQITKTATPTHADPGSTVTYTIVVTNTGKTTLTNATFIDNLTNVLDDATYNNDATGTVTYTAPNLTWTGDLAVGASATITYSVKVDNPDNGDHQLTNFVTSTTPGTNCDCTTTTPVSGLTITKKASTTEANPGDKVTYTVTVTNTGQKVQTGATFTDNLTNVLDDATYNADVPTTLGVVTYAPPNLTWTSTLPIGATATITYSVRINSQTPATTNSPTWSPQPL